MGSRSGRNRGVAAYTQHKRLKIGLSPVPKGSGGSVNWGLRGLQGEVWFGGRLGTGEVRASVQIHFCFIAALFVAHLDSAAQARIITYPDDFFV